MRNAGEDDGPDLLASTSAVVRLIAGWACVSIAVLDLSMGIDSDDVGYLVFHLVLLVGGGLLLAIDRLRESPRWHGPGRFGHAVGGAIAALGLLVSALPATSTVCCMRNLAVRHGYPVTLLAHDPGKSWHFAPAHAVADLVFWGLAGLAVAVVIALVRPARPADGQPAPARRPTHAEDRSAPAVEPARAADDENVGGLP